jgi:Protein of unknown function (DUF1207)
MELINADYVIGFPLSYRNGPLSARARLFHQSSHLGDEFLLPQRPELKVTRMNLSFETIELLGAWEWKGFQFTAGPSYILHTDSNLKRYTVSRQALIIKAGSRSSNRRCACSPASCAMPGRKPTGTPTLMSKPASTSAAPMPKNGLFRFSANITTAICPSASSTNCG